MIKTKDLPSKYLYTNVVRKDVGDRFVYGVDCVTLPENANSETVSKTIFESAQRAVGNFYASLAKLTVSRQASSEVNKPNLNLSQQVSAEVSKPKLLKPNIFKKFAQFLSKLIGHV